MTDRKEFFRNGKSVKTVKAHAYTRPDGTTGYTDNAALARAFNDKFAAPVIPARETFEGAA